MIVTVSVVVAVEAAAGALPTDPLLHTCAVRMADILIILAFARFFAPAASLPGLIPMDLKTGVIRGMAWSAGFGIIAALGLLGIFLAGYDPFAMLRVRLPAAPGRLFLFFMTAGVIGPLAEELFFRGVIFAGLRRWGFAVALAGSTLLFILAHPARGGIALPQAVGGLVFAFSYEIEKNLLVPFIIHATGNLALFCMTLAVF